MLGDGLCTRPIELDRHMKSRLRNLRLLRHRLRVLPVLLRQRDHARDHHQPDRATLFDELLNRLEEAT
jgi:hypothetical protein